MFTSQKGENDPISFLFFEGIAWKNGNMHCWMPIVQLRILVHVYV